MLLEATESCFAALVIGQAPPGFSLAEGGIDSPETMAMLRDLAQSLRGTSGPAAWMIIEADEIVGLISLVKPPTRDGEIEIGYGVAASRRGRGIASRAVADFLILAGQNSAVTAVLAETSVSNRPSRRALEQNAFRRYAGRVDAADGELDCWRHAFDRQPETGQPETS